jgi:hypothetical protein
MASRKQVELEFNIRGFTGLNLRDEASVIADTELSQCDNVDLQPGGHLTKRYGWGISGSVAESQPTKLLGLFYTGAIAKLIAATPNKVYHSNDGFTWVELQHAAASISDAEYGIQYLDNFYIIRSNSTIIEWDGAATVALTGSPDGDFAIVHKERLFVFNSQGAAEEASTIYFSDIGDFTSWPSDNFFRIKPGDGEPLIAGIVLQDVLILFKLNSTWGVYVQGDPSDWEKRLISSSIGCTSKYTPREIDGYVYFISTRGAYRSDGVRFEDISTKIEPVFKSRLVTPTTIQLDSAAWWEDKYIVAVATATPQVTWAKFADDGSPLAPYSWSEKYGVPWGASDVSYSYYVYHLKVEGWTQWKFAAFLTPSTFTEVRLDEPVRGLYGGDFSANGDIHRTLTQFIDEDDEIEIAIATKVFDLNQSLETKRGKWCGIDVEGQSISCNITYTLDGSDGSPHSITTTKTRGVYKVVGPGYFRTIKYKFYSRDFPYLAFYGFTTKMHIKRPQIAIGQ